MLGALLLPMAALAQNEIHHGPDIPADGRGNLIRQLPPRGQSGTGGSVVQGNGISYHNGPVMRNGVNIYYIWYGDWTQDATANAILTDYATYVGGSSYFNINTAYGDTVGNVPNTPETIKYGGSTSDTGSLGTSLNDGSIWTLVTNALKAGKFPADPNGVYFVLTAPFVAETSGFLTQYCGWHTYNFYNGTPIQYSFVGNAAANMGACSVQSNGPNGDGKADAMVSVIAHELEESATDPQLNAWYDSTGAENADKCAWTFGSTYAAPNGTAANMTIGPRNYLIQQNWVNAAGGYCAVSYSAPTTPDFSLSVSPGSQTVTAGQTTANYTMTATPSNGWSGSVAYSVTGGLPAGALANVGATTISITTTAGTTPAGTYNFTISGTDGKLTHTTQATLVVTVPTFSISISPSSQGVKRPSGSGNATATYTVTVTATTGYSGTVNLSASGATTGVSLTWGSSTSIPGGSGGSTLTATVTSSAKKGNNTLTVTGKDATTTKSVSASVRVN
jgi:hypothetical protein